MAVGLTQGVEELLIEVPDLLVFQRVGDAKREKLCVYRVLRLIAIDNSESVGGNGGVLEGIVKFAHFSSSIWAIWMAARAVGRLLST